jgi:hypothetical protein
MEAAISDTPHIYHSNETGCIMTESIFDQKMFDSLSDVSENDDNKTDENEDSDEFTFIDMPTSSTKNGIGITQITEGRFHTNFDAIGGFEFIGFFKF